MTRIITTVAMLALAWTAMAASVDEIRHYRTALGHRLVCTSNRWANYNPCSRVTLAEVKQIDVLAEDACQQGEDIIPHALYGDAGALNYRRVNRHMKREPYYVGFDAQGYEQGKKLGAGAMTEAHARRARLAALFMAYSPQKRRHQGRERLAARASSWAARVANAAITDHALGVSIFR
jgi:hypothetical protein